VPNINVKHDAGGVSYHFSGDKISLDRFSWYFPLQ
jgi:hypothetical protein